MPIFISSCYICDPTKWQVVRQSRNEYKCLNCNKVVKVVLQLKNKQPVSVDEGGLP